MLRGTNFNFVEHFSKPCQGGEEFHSRSGKALRATISKGDAPRDALRALFLLIKRRARALIKKDA